VADVDCGVPGALPPVPLRNQERTQATLFGTLLADGAEAMNPKLVVPLGGIAPFHASLRTVTLAPLCWNRPPHSCEMTCPFWNVQLTVQPVVAVVLRP